MHDVPQIKIKREFEIAADEPFELLGTNTAPNPQELLMSAVNACMTVGYVAGAALHGINLETLEIETTGQLDLRGFLGLDDSVPSGYEEIDYTVHIAGNGTKEQFEEIHRTVMKTSPNYFNLARPIRMNGRLRVG
ncbi:OsmC family protein [Govanella unica]|uniref:OsmC family protein n=1 Tax=Govanella unica TaxID=2975056 RepID=UPI0023A8B5A9|nr:OsmC family protein [Govania unica]